MEIRYLLTEDEYLTIGNELESIFRNNGCVKYILKDDIQGTIRVLKIEDNINNILNILKWKE